MIGVAVFVLTIVIVIFVLPLAPRWVRVGFWVMLTIGQIAWGSALFAAVNAAIATSEWHRP